MLLRICRLPSPITHAALFDKNTSPDLADFSAIPRPPTRAIRRSKANAGNVRAGQKAAQTGGCGRKGRANGMATSAAFPFFSSVRLIRRGREEKLRLGRAGEKAVRRKRAGASKNQDAGGLTAFLRTVHSARARVRTYRKTQKGCGGKSHVTFAAAFYVICAYAITAAFTLYLRSALYARGAPRRISTRRVPQGALPLCPL